ncbi:MAG: LacI family DNA-binding transcriptional regulator [Acidobacteria bacterium]|nr:LacI family DNA-binding transcriptional regulator [Acidobacteriota bacterium]
MASRMKDIARDLGVSVITVSKVLRNHPDISQETRQRVMKRMEEVNYQPNPAARALVTGRTYSVGLIVPDLVHSFFAELAVGLSRVLRAKGYGLFISSSEENVELERKEIEELLTRRADALLVASAQWTVESFRRIEERKTPYVLLDRQFIGLPANFVGIDDEQAGILATSHLIAAGCRRIAHIRGPEVSTAMGRLNGYRVELRRNSLEAPAGYVVQEETGDKAGNASGYRAMNMLLHLDPKPDGVFCYNDPSAMGAMQAILEAGLRIPQDVAVIGCGNVVYAPFLRIPLSSVDQNSVDMGARAGELAIMLIESKTPPKPQSILLQPRVVPRASTAR